MRDEISHAEREKVNKMTGPYIVKQYDNGRCGWQLHGIGYNKGRGLLKRNWVWAIGNSDGPGAWWTHDETEGKRAEALFPIVHTWGKPGD